MAHGPNMEVKITLLMKRQSTLFIQQTQKCVSMPYQPNFFHPLRSYIPYWAPIYNLIPQTQTSKNEVTTLRNFNNLSLLNKFTDTSTSAGTVNLQTVNNGVDSDELHLWIAPSSRKNVP